MSEDVYRMDMEYFLNDDLMGGQAVSAVDESPLDAVMAFRLEPRDFPEGSSLEDFSFHMVLCFDQVDLQEMFTSSENILATNPCEPFTPEYGKVYYYTVTGSFAEGLILQPADY
jgi:hypothetical protein